MDYDAFNRRNAIMDRLIERRKVSSGEFAREFSVSRNTIASDIAHLSKIFPISSSTGRNGGYFYTGERFVSISRGEAEIILSYTGEAKNYSGKVKDALERMRAFVSSCKEDDR